jgi:hypothetical protein
MSEPSPAAVALGRRSGEARRERRDVVARVVEASRRAQGLDRHVTDIEVLERVAAFLEAAGEDGDDAAA